MALLDKLRQELDRAGRSAQRAFDEGRIRLELYRARQSADKFAQRFATRSFAPNGTAPTSRPKSTRRT